MFPFWCMCLRIYKRRTDLCVESPTAHGVYIEITGSSWTGGQFQSAQHVIIMRQQREREREREREKEEIPFLLCLVRELKGNTRRWEKKKKKSFLMSKPQGFACNFHSPLSDLSPSSFFSFFLFFVFSFFLFILFCSSIFHVTTRVGNILFTDDLKKKKKKKKWEGFLK